MSFLTASLRQIEFLRHDGESGVLAPAVNPDRVIVIEISHHSRLTGRTPAVVAKDQSLIAQWAVSLHCTFTKFVDQRPLFATHLLHGRQGRPGPPAHASPPAGPAAQPMNGVEAQVQHAVQKEFVVRFLEVDLPAVERTVEGSIDVRARPGRLFRRQEYHENALWKKRERLRRLLPPRPAVLSGQRFGKCFTAAVDGGGAIHVIVSTDNFESTHENWRTGASMDATAAVLTRSRRWRVRESPA